jgi:Cu/Ag efflux pump CusA
MGMQQEPGAMTAALLKAVGGLATSCLLELAVYPALFAIWKGRDLAPEPVETSPPP